MRETIRPHTLRRVGLILGAVCAVSVLAASLGRAGQAQPPQPKAEVEFKIATLAPEGTPVIDIFRQMDQEVRAKTGGKVGFKLYPGGTMGEEKAVVSKIKLNQLHGGAFTGMGLGDILPAVRAIEVPFQFRNYEECDAALAAVGDTLRKLFEDEGWIEMGHTEVGFVYVLSIKKIRSVEELRKSRIALITGDPLAQLAMEVVGLSPLPQNVTDVLTSLATGTIDTVYVPPAYAIALQWNTKTKFMIDYPFTYSTGALVVRKKQFDLIPAAMQSVVLEITRRHTSRLTPQTRKDETEAIDQMKKQGIQVTELEAQETQGFEKVGQQIREKMPTLLAPNDTAKQEQIRALVATIVKAVADTRAGKGAPGRP